MPTTDATPPGSLSAALPVEPQEARAVSRTRALLLMAAGELRESLRTRWFQVSFVIFCGAVLLLFALRVTESQVLGFTGLGRLLLTYVQLTVAILPIFVLVTTVRAVVGDKETLVMEYMLSLPMELGAYFWGKLAGRTVVTVLPVLAGLVLAAGWGLAAGLEVPWGMIAYYAALLSALAWCFLGFGMLISAAVRRLDWGLGLALLVWLACLLLLDLVLLGVLIRSHLPEQLVLLIALLNPLQSFRIAAILLFDPELSVMGATAFLIQDMFGSTGFLVWAVCYPLALGAAVAAAGFALFRKGDLI